MVKNRSGQKRTPEGFVGGTPRYRQSAAPALLPILVWQAGAIQPVFYKALANEKAMPFALSLNKALGTIVHELPIVRRNR